ncbi:MAG: fasciclin domain-containing protein, partial [Flavobacteriales bacterium]|nr:fasciclin domain-containing protein [Flavobacteriales bacterium]
SAVHTSLVAAVVEARLLPALTDPFEKYTVFAPTNTAFDNAVTALGLADINALLASSDLTSILLYHVLGSEVLEADLANGMVPTLNGQSVTVDISGPTINTSNITATDLLADNGVVHVLDAVLVPSLAGIEESQIEILSVYPNPASNVLNINNLKGNYEVVSIYGEVVKSGTLSNNTIDVSELSTGNYFIKLTNNTTVYQAKFIKL